MLLRAGRTVGAVAAAVLLVAAQAAHAAPDPVLAAAGDIACAPGSTTTATACQQQATADLVSSNAPTAVAVLGDNQYQSGTYAEYTGTGAFGATWGAFKSSIHPALGNHEYGQNGTSAPDGYFDYFDGVGAAGGPAGDRGDGWYSYDLGVWHLIVLNSSDDCAPVSCAAGKPEETWLKNDLAAHPGQCTIAYWHHPRFTSGPDLDDTAVTPFWDDLYAAHAAIVLNGHDHDYERFGPQDPTGVATVDGIREFVAGTGGKDHFPFSGTDANSEFRDDQHFGALFLTLHQGSYDWAFKDAATGNVLDSGSSDCHWQPPQAMTGDASGVTAGGSDVSGTVDPHGDATTDHFEWGATTGYGSSTADVDAGSGSGPEPASATLAGLAPSTTYHYRLVARSPAGTSFGADRTFVTAPAPQPSPAPGSSASSPPGTTGPMAIIAPAPGGAAPSQSGSPPLTAALHVHGAERLADVLRHGVRLTLRCSRPCTVRVTLFLAGLSKAARRSAGGAVVSVAAGHTAVVRVRLNAAARRRLGHVSGGRISVRLDASSGGERAHTAGAVRLRR